MDVARLLAYCQAEPGAWPDDPWDPDDASVMPSIGLGLLSPGPPVA